jgi:Domain of unknown function (DUF4369)
MKHTGLNIFTYGFALLTILTNCKSNNSKNLDSTDYFLKGNIKGIDTGWIYLKHRQTGNIDSALIENGSFMVTGKTENPEFCNIGIGSSGKRDFYFGFFLTIGNMTLNAKKDSLIDAAVNIEGYTVQDEFKQFQKLMRPIDLLSNEIWLTEKTFDNHDSLDSKARELEKKRKEIIWNYAVQNPNSYITAFEASSYFTEKEDLYKLESIFNIMIPTLQKWYYSEKIKEYLKENNFNVEK